MKCESKYPEEVVDAMAEQLNVAARVPNHTVTPWGAIVSSELRESWLAEARLALDLGAVPRGWVCNIYVPLDGPQVKTWTRKPTPTPPDPVAEARQKASGGISTASKRFCDDEVRAWDGVTAAQIDAMRTLLAYIDAVAAKGAVGK